MVKQKGTKTWTGKMGDLSYYKRKGEWLVRRAAGPSAETIATNPNYAVTRKNNTEFGMASKYSKLFRDALKPILHDQCDGDWVNRVNACFFKIIRMDDENPHGERLLKVGLHKPEAIHLLNQLKINEATGGAFTFQSAPQWQLKDDVFAWSEITQMKWVPENRSYQAIGFNALLATFDLDQMQSRIEASDAQVLEISELDSPLEFNISTTSHPNSFRVLVIRATALQIINNTYVALQNQSLNCFRFSYYLE